MITRSHLTMVAVVVLVAFSSACGTGADNNDTFTRSATDAAAASATPDMPQEFDGAVGDLEESLVDLEAAANSARNREFPPVVIDSGEDTEPHRTDADHLRFCTDNAARSAELELRKRGAVKAWYFELAESSEPMRDITDKETQAIHEEVEAEFARELKVYRSSHPDVPCAD